jgi:hypothetical protein
MTLSSVTLPVDSPALIRVSGELCLLPGVRAPRLIQKRLRSRFRSALNLRPPSRPRLQPRAALSVTGKNPFNPQ